jgi:hypothetical protein
MGGGGADERERIWKRNCFSRKKKKENIRRLHVYVVVWVYRGVLFINKFCFPSNSEIKRTTVACAHVYVCVNACDIRILPITLPYFPAQFVNITIAVRRNNHLFKPRFASLTHNRIVHTCIHNLCICIGSAGNTPRTLPQLCNQMWGFSFVGLLMLFFPTFFSCFFFLLFLLKTKQINE